MAVFEPSPGEPWRQVAWKTVGRGESTSSAIDPPRVFALDDVTLGERWRVLLQRMSAQQGS